MMHKTLVAAAVAGSLALAPGLAAPAHADHSDWYAGGGFRIGPVHFSIVLGKPGYRHRGQHYYRSEYRLDYRGYRCTDRCFKRGGDYYHEPYCPVVLHHFDRYGANPYATWERYAPRQRAPYLEYGGRYRGYDDDYGRRGHRHHRGGEYCPYRH